MQNRNFHVQKHVCAMCLGDNDCENEYKDVEIDENREDKSDSDSESSDDN